jgi:uncharacterized protein (TIGR03083 family)
MPLTADRYYAQIETGASALADVLDASSPDLHIPTCPDWTLRQLVTHVGRAHRWAAEIVRTRAPEPIPFRAVPDGALPADPTQRGPWLRAGARLLVDSVRAAGDERVWAFSGSGPAVYWARRMAHETLVHLADAQMASGRAVEMDPVIAADAVDEWLGASGPAPGNPGARVLPAGAVLHLHATDPGVENGEWLIRNTPDGIAVEPGHGKGDAALTGPAQSLLLVLLRRWPPADPSVTLYGDPGVLTAWLDSSPF